MKKLLLGAVTLTMLATACKKSDDGGSSSNTFYVNGTSHTAGTVVRQAALNALQAVENASSSSVSQVIISFKTLPTASGSFKVVNSANNANELDITYQSGTTTLYESSNTNTNATVTVDGNKIKVSVPDVYLKNFGSSTDSVKFSGSFSEQ